MTHWEFASRPPFALGWALMKGKKGGHGRSRPEPPDEPFEEDFVHDAHFGPGPRFGPHFGGGPMFGFPFGGRGRKRRGDVRAALLLLLAEEPRNGYQLMQEIEERSGGRWRPSPGSVYPALAQLEDEGLVRAVERDGAKLFEITDAGREHLEQRESHSPPWELADDPEFRTFSDLRSLLKQVAIATAQVGQAGDERQLARASEVLTETRRALYRILAEDKDA